MLTWRSACASSGRPNVRDTDQCSYELRCARDASGRTNPRSRNRQDRIIRQQPGYIANRTQGTQDGACAEKSNSGNGPCPAVTSPSGAQVAAKAPANTASGRIENIAPEEMWKRVTQCAFPTHPGLAF